MNAFELNLLNVKERAVSAALGLVCSVACIAAVVAVFASASGELDVALARLKSAPAASAVADKSAVKPPRG